MTPETYKHALALIHERERIERDLDLIERVDDVRLLRASTSDRVSVELTNHPIADSHGVQLAIADCAAERALAYADHRSAFAQRV